MGGQRGAQRLDEGLRISEQLGDPLARGLIVNARGWLSARAQLRAGTGARRSGRRGDRRGAESDVARSGREHIVPPLSRPARVARRRERLELAISTADSDGRGRAELRRCGCVGMGAATDG